jgi:hypothetical protein
MFFTHRKTFVFVPNCQCISSNWINPSRCVVLLSYKLSSPTLFVWSIHSASDDGLFYSLLDDWFKNEIFSLDYAKGTYWSSSIISSAVNFQKNESANLFGGKILYRLNYITLNYSINQTRERDHLLLSSIIHPGK